MATVSFPSTERVSEIVKSSTFSLTIAFTENLLTTVRGSFRDVYATSDQDILRSLHITDVSRIYSKQFKSSLFQFLPDSTPSNCLGYGSREMFS